MSSTPANVKRTGSGAVVDGHAVKWEETGNILLDAGAITETSALVGTSLEETRAVTATAAQTVFPPATPFSALDFANGSVCVKQTVFIGGATKVVVPTAVNLSTGAVTIAAAAVSDVVRITWIAPLAA